MKSEAVNDKIRQSDDWSFCVDCVCVTWWTRAGLVSTFLTRDMSGFRTRIVRTGLVLAHNDSYCYFRLPCQQLQVWQQQVTKILRKLLLHSKIILFHSGSSIHPPPRVRWIGMSIEGEKEKQCIRCSCRCMESVNCAILIDGYLAALSDAVTLSASLL